MERRAEEVPALNVVLYIVVACVAAMLLVYLAVRRGRTSRGIETAQKLMSELDIEAFRNLVDPNEEEFLRESLPLREFKKAKRERAWAAFAYVWTLSEIAVEFGRVGSALRQSPEPRRAKLGKELASGAVHLRLLTLSVSGRLLLSMAFPNSTQPSPKSLLEEYGRSAGLVVLCSLLERAHRPPAGEVTA